jgi:hypothetical protein
MTMQAFLSAFIILLGFVPQGAQQPAPKPADEQIFFSQTPALLIRIDGDPVYRRVDGTDLQRVVNTHMLIVKDFSGAHYLKILDGWMETYSLADSWWTVSGVAPVGAEEAVKEASADKNIDLLDDASLRGAGLKVSLEQDKAPAIFIATGPSDLVVTDGAPRFATMPNSSLQYIANTSARVFREPTDQELYLHVPAGWFRAWKPEGPWQPLSNGDLPADLAGVRQTELKSNSGGEL